MSILTIGLGKDAARIQGIRADRAEAKVAELKEEVESHEWIAKQQGETIERQNARIKDLEGECAELTKRQGRDHDRVRILERRLDDQRIICVERNQLRVRVEELEERLAGILYCNVLERRSQAQGDAKGES